MLKHTEGLKDYRGKHLCEPCWNGQHFTTKLIRIPCSAHKKDPTTDADEVCKYCRWKSTSQKVCNCNLGNCECDCSAMGPDWQEHMRNIRKISTEHAKTQTDLPGVEMLNIKAGSM